MDAMPMPAGAVMSMEWMPMCGQSWLAAAASFLGMWTAMMGAMMLPSLLPALWRYRRSVAGAGELPRVSLTLLAGAGYFLVWTLLGAALYPLGAAIMTTTMRYPALGHAAPIAVGLVVLAAGVLQLTRWKAHHLACCLGGGHGRESLRCGCGRPIDALSALRHGLRLGLHCAQCCAGLTAVLLVTGIMDVPAMVAVTAAINLERFVPAGARVARIIGLMMVVAGVLMSARAVGLWL